MADDVLRRWCCPQALPSFSWLWLPMACPHPHHPWPGPSLASPPPMWPPPTHCPHWGHISFPAMSLTCQKSLLAFLCQLDKIPNSLARHMSLIFHSLSPACPAVSSPTVPAGPVPSTCPEYTQFQASAWLFTLPAMLFPPHLPGQSSKA